MTDSTRAQLTQWTLSLVEGWQTDPAVDAKDGRSCLSLVGAEPLAFARALAAGGAFAFEAGMDAGVDKGWLRVALPTPDLDRRLTLMRRAARRALADRGEHVLWIALGLLVWQAPDGIERTSPLALLPVELERSASGGLRLVAADSVLARINPALIGALERELAMIPTWPGEGGAFPVVELSTLFDAADGIALTRPDWRVERSAKLGVFSLARHTLAAELSARIDELAAHPIVSHLAASAAGEQRPFAQPSIAAAEAVTRPAPSAELLAPLDADASQLAAIAAAAAGATFVLQAPPGTGASQTIANLAVHVGAHGKRVLVVSDKAAALDTIVQRLAALGLGDMCLPLHGMAGERSRVLGQLARVVERTFRPGAGPSSAAAVDARLGELRVALDSHVAALHAVGPFGRSLHDVLGRLIELRASASADLAERDAVGLDRATFDRRLAAVAALASAALPVEPVATHAWRASSLDYTLLGATDVEVTKATALASLDDAGAAVELLATCVAEISASVPGLTAKTREQLSALGALAVIAAASPRPGAEMLTNLRLSRDEDLDEKVALIRARGAGAVEVPRDPLAFLALAHKHRALAAEVGEQFADAVEQLDASAMWTQLRKWTNSVGPLRFVTLRTVRAEVKAVALGGRLESDSAMINGLEAVIAERATRVALTAAAEPARRWFGELGGDPLALDLSKLDEAVAWSAELRKSFEAVHIAGGDAARANVWRALVAQVAAGIPVPAAWSSSAEPNAFARLADAVARWSPAIGSLSRATGIPSELLAAGDDHLVALRDKIAALRHAIDSLPAWTAFHGARHTARTVGIDTAVTAIERGDLGASELAPAWERATLLAWADAELGESAALSQFHGASHHAQVAAYADLDRGSLALARARAVVKLAELAPRANKDATGEIAILLAELHGTAAARGLSVRAVLAAMPTTLGKIAPCILATPAAVSELLDPALPAFDVVVIDEASRLSTPAVLAALSRGAAAVFVGDHARSLPLVDPLLGTALQARLPEVTLAWHYRSKHEDLIAYTNDRAYASRLHVLPAAAPSSELGVALRTVEGGALDHDSLTNLREAEALVADVLARLSDPAQRTRSIGVVAFTAAQRELIEDLLDAAREGDPALDAAVEPGPDATFEPLLVTDLAHVTGDERDVILISAVYTDVIEHGPLTAPNGDRALLGALSCAREQLVVFSSLDHTALPVDASPGVRELAAFLAFAARGGGALRRTLDESSPPPVPASPITLAIARALTERGWTLRHQVGVGPYTLDLAVVDPTDPERFVLAIEHDGAAYASAPHARDRDRLRPAILAQLGWRVHRVWGLDWWADAEREVQRAHGAIVTAIAAHRAHRGGRAPAVAKQPSRLSRASVQPPISAAGSQPVSSATSRPRTASGSSPVAKATRSLTPASTALAMEKTTPTKTAARTAPTGVPTARTDAGGTDAVFASGSGPASAPTLAAYDGPTTPVKIARNAIAIGPYTAAAIPSGRRTPDDLFAPRYLAEVGKIIDQVLAAEAPMHIDLLARRVGGYFGIGRLTARVTEQVRLALEGRGRSGDEDQIVWRLDQDPASVPPVRVAGGNAAARRSIDEVPLVELASAARIVVERASGITTSELVRDAARLLGFARMTEQVTERVTLGVRLAVARELVRVSDANKVMLPD